MARGKKVALGVVLVAGLIALSVKTGDFLSSKWWQWKQRRAASQVAAVEVPQPADVPMPAPPPVTPPQIVPSPAPAPAPPVAVTPPRPAKKAVAKKGPVRRAPAKQAVRTAPVAVTKPPTPPPCLCDIAVAQAQAELAELEKEVKEARLRLATASAPPKEEKKRSLGGKILHGILWPFKDRPRKPRDQ